MKETQIFLLVGYLRPDQRKDDQVEDRDSGNDFWVPKIGLDNSHFSLILFLYPHVVPSRSSKRLSFLGADFCFWS